MTSYLNIFLQTTGYLRLKVSLLQDSFVREIWNRVGKQAYLETIHPLVLSNLYNSPDKSSAASASVLLISSSEELGVPITIHQVFWFCNNLPGYLTMFSFIHMPPFLLMCNNYCFTYLLFVNQTILPLVHCFGKGLCSDGIDVLVRIGILSLLTFIFFHLSITETCNF